MMDGKLLKNEERAVFSLRALYRQYGYLPFKMSQFEEYDFYMRNKDFLVSERIITFNDTDGKLLALKPDVTLSIIKNGSDVKGCKQKVCYNENVYRVSGRTEQYKEILQTGLECIGDIDAYDLYEVVSLAVQSLAAVSDRFLLQVSHLGILSALLDEAGGDETFRREVTHCVAEKNAHDLARICAENNISPAQTEKLTRFVGIYGVRDQVLRQLETLCTQPDAVRALEELKALSALLDGTEHADRVCFDFSIVNDMNYYNGFVFQGFLEGVSENVLAGGQYDHLMHRMHRNCGAVGFALYLDLLEELDHGGTEYAADVLLLYKEEDDRAALAAAVRELVQSGKSVSVQKAVPPKLRFREQMTLQGKGDESTC